MVHADGNASAYVAGTGHRPLPTAVVDTTRRGHQPQAKRGGIDWAALTPVCAACGQKSGQLGDGGLCPPCRGVVVATAPGPKVRHGKTHTYAELDQDDVEKRYVDDTRLGRALAELEETDPDVRRSADRLADVVDRILRPDDHVRPENLTTEEQPCTTSPSAPSNVPGADGTAAGARSSGTSKRSMIIGSAASAKPPKKPTRPSDAPSQPSAPTLQPEASTTSSYDAGQPPATPSTPPAGPPTPDAASADRSRALRRFDDAAEQRIAAEYAAGATTKALAATYGCSDVTIGNVVRRQGGTLRASGTVQRAGVRLTSDVQASIVSRYQAGESCAAIAHDLGIGHSTPMRVLAAAGIQRRTHGESVSIARRKETPCPTPPAATPTPTARPRSSSPASPAPSTTSAAPFVASPSSSPDDTAASHSGSPAAGETADTATSSTASPSTDLAAAELDAQIAHAAKVLRDTHGVRHPIGFFLRRSAMSAIEALHLWHALEGEMPGADVTPVEPRRTEPAQEPVSAGQHRRTAAPKPRKARAYLTDAQVDEVVRLYEEGHSQRAIANSFGVAQTSVSRYLKSRGVPTREWPYRHTNQENQ